MSRAIPIFLFHRVGPRPQCRFTVPVDVFKHLLEKITEAGYETITCTDLAAYISAGREIPAKTCMLTFDDGYLDNYVYAFPLLKQSGHRGTIFVVSDRIGHGAARPTLSDHWCGRVELNSLYQPRDFDDINLGLFKGSSAASADHVVESELRIMAASGTMDVQAHGASHGVHFVGPTLRGFLSASSHWTARAALGRDGAPGMPVYSIQSVLVQPKFKDSLRVRERCAQALERLNPSVGELDIRANDVMQAQWALAVQEFGEGEVEPIDDWRKRASAELTVARERIQAITGLACKCLAWPFGRASAQAWSLAEGAGYQFALVSRAGGFAVGVAPWAVGRINLKSVNEDRFCALLHEWSSPARIWNAARVARHDEALEYAT